MTVFLTTSPIYQQNFGKDKGGRDECCNLLHRKGAGEGISNLFKIPQLLQVQNLKCLVCIARLKKKPCIPKYIDYINDCKKS